MTYNKSEIMRSAWKTFKTVQASQIRKTKPYFDSEAEVMEQVALNMKPFSYYLKEAWGKAKSDAKIEALRQAKRLTTTVYARELAAGDVIEVTYGLGVGVTANRKIASIEKSSSNSAWEILVRYEEEKDMRNLRNYPNADKISLFKPNDVVFKVKAA